MDITPHTNLLKSVRAERINYILLIGEAIDNAFDAGASRVDVSISSDSIAFKDDGAGITRDRIGAIFTLGNHASMGTTQLGRFGIGITSQAISAGDVFSVSSTSRDGKFNCDVNWRILLRSNIWEMPDPVWRPVAVGSSTGTSITISELRKSPSTSLEKISRDLALRFYPALAEGKRIAINKIPVPILLEPQMAEVVDRAFSLSGGRSATLRAGILTGPSDLNRVHVAFRHRVIMPRSTLGCGEYGGLNRMFARLQLSGPWHLAKFKDDLTDEIEREELEDAVLDALRPILEKCNCASMEAKIREVNCAINDMLPEELAAARPEKKKIAPSSSGNKLGKQNRPVSKSNGEGPARIKKPQKDRLLITFDGSACEDGIGAFVGGNPHRIDLAADEPYIAKLLQNEDQYSLFAIAIAIFVQGRFASELELESFGNRISKILSLQHLERGEVSPNSAVR